MKHISFCLLFAAVAITITSCRRTPAGPPTIKVPYNGPYEITMHEWRSLKQLSLDVQTEEALNCANYYIVTGGVQEQGIVRLTLEGLARNGYCEPGQDKARTSEQYELVNGTYPVSITNNGITESGTITVTDSAYIMDYNGQNGVTFTDKVMRRLPKGTIHGVIYSFSSAAFSDAQSFIDSMIFYGAQPFIGDTVKYDRITVRPGNTFTWDNDNSRSDYYRNFIYTWTGNIEDLKKLAGRYDQRSNGELSIFIEDPDGNIINSYAVDF